MCYNPLLDPFVTSFLGFAPPALRKASTRIRSLRMTRLGLLFFKAPSGRELPTESGEGEGVRLGDCLAIVSAFKQGVSVILSGVEGSLPSVAKSNKRIGWL